MSRKEKRDLVKEYRRTLKHIKRMAKMFNGPVITTEGYSVMWDGYLRLLCHRMRLFEIIYIKDGGFRSAWREGRRDALGYKVRWK